MDKPGKQNIEKEMGKVGKGWQKKGKMGKDKKSILIRYSEILFYLLHVQ